MRKALLSQLAPGVGNLSALIAGSLPWPFWAGFPRQPSFKENLERSPRCRLRAQQAPRSISLRGKNTVIVINKAISRQGQAWCKEGDAAVAAALCAGNQGRRGPM